MFPLPQVQDANVVENLEDFHDEQVLFYFSLLCWMCFFVQLDFL